MRGYKGMRHDMTCRGMKYEIGKTYHVDGDISVCRNGLHFCEKLIDVLNFYDINDGSRYFEVEAGGKIKKDEIKCVASSLTIIREIHTIELNRAIYDPGYGSGYGYGDDIYGDGYGDGSDYGYKVCGDGYKYGYSNGSGYGFGNGSGYGDLHGYGYGHGYSDIFGDGYGNGHGYRHGYIKDIVKYV